MKHVFRIFKKNKTPLTIVTIIFFCVGFIVSNFFMPKLYQSKAVMMVITPDKDKIDYQSIIINQQLAKTYSNLVLQRSVLQQVAKELDFPVTVSDLSKAIEVSQGGNSELIEIRVEFSSSQKAALIANVTADIMIDHIKSLMGFSNIKLIDAAVENKTPIQPKPLLYTVSAGFIGFFLASTWCLIVNNVRQVVYGKEDLEGLDLPILGEIDKFEGKRKRIAQGEVALNDFWSLLASGFKAANYKQTILVTSANRGEGKSTVSLGLAICLAKMGKEVVLVDANFKNPVQHINLNIKPKQGLVNLLNLKETKHTLLQSTDYPTLRLVSVGDLKTNDIETPFKVLSSESFENFLGNLTKQADMVLIDGPDILNDAEALSLAMKVDGVLMVGAVGLPIQKLLEAIRRLNLVSTNIIGVVLNNK